MIVGQILDRLIGPLDAGIEEDEEIDAADGDDPEEEEAERAELGERIERRAEQPLERPLDQFKAVPKHAAHRADHGDLLRFIGLPARLFAGHRRLRARRHSRSRMAAETSSENARDHAPEHQPVIDAIAAGAGIVGRADELDAVDDAA